MNTLRAGTQVRYVLRPDYGVGVVQWISPPNRLMVRFVNAHPMYEGEFAAAELEEAVEAHA